MGVILQKMRNDDVFRQVRRWVTPSENQKNIHIRMGLPASRIDVVPYYLSVDTPPPPPAPQGGVLFLGRLSPEKGVDVLLRAWAHVSSKGRPLLIAGTGPEEARLKQLAAELQLQNVRWLGFVPRRDLG
jgi:glycosyltransferase involved in cell wall biosynthesis